MVDAPCGVAAASRTGDAVAVSDAGQRAVLILSTNGDGADVAAFDYLTGEAVPTGADADLRLVEAADGSSIGWNWSSIAVDTHTNDIIVATLDDTALQQLYSWIDEIP